jgi:hypothetical protein
LKTFFKRLQLIPWVKNRPPAFELEPRGAGVFKLRLLANVEIEEADAGENRALLEIDSDVEGEPD